MIRRILGGSRTGRLHASMQTPCQDACGWVVCRGMSVMAVADGAGSQPRSAEGSHAAVQAVIDYAGNGDDGLDGLDWLTGAFVMARQTVHRLAEAEGAPIDDYATTLGVAVVNDQQLLVGQVGDSIVVVEHADGQLSVVEPEEKGEYANETSFLTAPSGLSKLRRTRLAADDIEGVALSTDGLRFQILDLANMEAYEPFFQDVFEYVRGDGPSSAELERYLRELEDQSGDDLTLVIGVHGDSIEAAGADDEADVEAEREIPVAGGRSVPPGSAGLAEGEPRPKPKLADRKPMLVERSSCGRYSMPAEPEQ